MAFLNTDKLWYFAQYNNAGDFAKLIGPYNSLAEANKAQNLPESTPAGELVEDDEVVVSVDEAKGTDPVTDPEVTPAQVEETKAELIAEGAIVEPTVAPESEPVAPVQPEVAPTEPTAPEVAPEVAPETAPVAPESAPTEETAPVAPEVAPETVETAPEAPVEAPATPEATA